MQSIQLLISAVLTNLVYYCTGPRVVIKHTVETVTEVVEKKDPTGLVRNDLAHIEKMLPDPRWRPGVDPIDLAYNHGMHALARMISDKLVHKR